MTEKKKNSKPSMFFGFVLSVGLHLFLVITILFWGFNSPASIKKAQSITGRLVTIEKAARSGPRGSARPKKQAAPKPPKKETKPEVVEKKEPKKIKKPEVVKKPPKKADPPKPKPPDKNVVNLNEKKQTVKKPPKPTPKPQPKKVVKKTPSAEQQRKKIMEEMMANKEKQAREEERSDILENIDRSRTTKQVAKRGPNGYDIGGAESNPALVGLFVEQVRNEIASNWNIPPNIPTDGSLESRLFFRIDENGRLFGIRIEKSSGNSLFDRFCITALKKASPLNTPPPPEIVHEAKIEGVEVSFSNSAL